MSKIEQLQHSREFVRHTTAQFPHILEGEPESWWRSTAKLLIQFKNGLANDPNPEVQEYYGAQVEKLLNYLRLASITTPNDLDDLISFADHLIMKFSMEIAAPFEKKEFAIETHFISIEALVNAHPDRLKIEHRIIQNVDCIVLHVKHPTREEWHEIPLPKHKAVWHKGGPARAVLNILADAPLSMQESEFPWNDFDALVGDGRKNKKAALSIGVDADGIEYMGESQLNFRRYCAGRDTTQNQICLGADGLHYSESAHITATTGHTMIENEYVANKAIYGFDKMILQGEVLAKPRGLMRLIKAVVEGKALSFDYIPLNSLFDIGMQCLFLAKKWSKREQFPEYLQRMYYVLQQMGQIHPGENDIFDFLERAHTQYSFFDFDSEVREPLEVVRWKSRKLVKQIDREMAWQFKIPSGMEVRRTAGDTLPARISLEGFAFDASQVTMREQWDRFLTRARERTALHKSQDLTPYEKVFSARYSDADFDADAEDSEVEAL